MHVLCVYALKLLSGFFGEDRLATLHWRRLVCACSKSVVWRSGSQPFLAQGPSKIRWTILCWHLMNNLSKTQEP